MLSYSRAVSYAARASLYLPSASRAFEAETNRAPNAAPKADISTQRHSAHQDSIRMKPPHYEMLLISTHEQEKSRPTKNTYSYYSYYSTLFPF